MNRWALLLLLAGAALAGSVLVHDSSVAAPSDQFRYKWPYASTTSATITTYPFQDVHGCSGKPETNPAYPYECVDAYDMVVASRQIVSSQEGTVTDASNTVKTCDANGHLGTYVYVNNIKYGHLSSIAPGVTVGAHLLQGDAIGVQGNTGNTLPPKCGEHLHWEFGGVQYGDSLATIDGGSGSSTNSVIGEYSTAGATLRGYYVAHGGFNTIGWTHANCPGACTLNMFSNLTWGRMQDFQHDPDGFGQSLATVQVANWDTGHAYRADGLIWPAWAAGAWDPARGVSQPLSMARQDSGSCPVGSTANCVTYQRFHFGYVWVNTSGQAAAAFCPDIYPLPDGDGTISATDADWAFSVFKYGPYDARADLNGDGVVSSTEPQIIFNQFKKAPHCYP